MSSEKQPPSLRPQSNLYSGWKPQNPSSTVTKSPGSTSSFPSSTSHKTISSPTSGFSPSGGSSFASPKPSFVGNRQNFYSFPTSQSSPSSPSSDTMAGSNATQTSLISIPALQGIAVESDSPSLLINSSNFPALNAPALSTSPRSNSLPLSNLFVDEQRKSHSPSTLPSLSVPANEVPLESSWSFWFFRPTLSSSTDLSRESSLRFVGCFTSVLHLLSSSSSSSLSSFPHQRFSTIDRRILEIRQSFEASQSTGARLEVFFLQIIEPCSLGKIDDPKQRRRVDDYHPQEEQRIR